MGKFQEKVYNNLPYPFKFVLLNIKAFQNTKQRYTKEFHAFLEEYIALWNADSEVIKNYQKERLVVLLSEAYEHSAWYSEKMKELGITLKTIQENPHEALAKMPILKKSERKTNADKIVNTGRNTDGVGYTSGTSGSPTINYLDSESINRSFALWRRFHKAIGLDTQKVRQVRFSGRLMVRPDAKKPPFWVYNYFERQLLMSTYHLTDNNLGHYVKKLNSFKPILLDGYPSAIYILSRYINQNDLKLSFTPKAIAVTAETLYDYQRLEIQKAFNCHVFNQYASSEGSPFITECVEGNLHLNLDSGVFEFINTKGETAKAGEVAQLVVTSFTNLKTPLIRYNIEDTVLLSENNKKCTCGCEMPIIEKLTGREDDILWTEEKGYVGRMDTAYKGLEGIVKSQIIQESPKEIIVNLIADQQFDDTMKKNLVHNLKTRLGENISYKINTVEDIPLGPNGKFDAVKRNFKIEL
ncbi:phenylacetate--CoA ligase family protein [Aquimarina sp. AD10]|uniref:phenylacetate--CoA ligase family protein n=1 Tax=Aquimarina sp. AD10 TaxID=1714849 RepID=UPI000E471EFB|nr:phenylacetate--CoA ligase family protein [Aquimarina sp. AD10]AXT59932.1 phenylacetate--CoA ligase family protein [Aquimarina sp. AD10]RKM95651.1 phenylacetate--CoA ligase family protein [Aquimarina sp. AD10]